MNSYSQSSLYKDSYIFFFQILTGTSVKKLELLNANKITNNQNLVAFTAPLYWCSGL